MQFSELDSDVKEYQYDILKLKKLQNDFLHQDYYKDDFYKLNQDPLLDEIEYNYKKINTKINTLIQNEKIIDYELEQNLRMIEKDFEQFYRLFKLLTSNLRDIGNQNNGLVKDVLTTQNEMDQLIKSVNEISPSALQYYNYFKKSAQKIFLLKDDTEYEKFISIYNIIKTEILESTYSNPYQKYIAEKYIDLIDTYKINIDHIYQKITTIGKNDTEGLLAQQYDFLTKIEHKSSDIVNFVDKNNQKSIAFSIRILLILVFIIGVLFVTFIWLVTKSILTPINRLKEYIKELSTGSIPEKIFLKAQDEITEMAKTLNIFISGIQHKVSFAKTIGDGNLNKEFTPLSDKDSLGNALLEMQNSLLIAQDEDNKRKEKDELHDWVNSGIASISDILRKHTDNIERLAFEVLKYTIDYIEGNQGGIFFFNDENPEDPFLEQVASYAYNKQKLITRRIDMGEGLVGICAEEKNKLVIDNLTDDYIKITSGFGEANPTNLIILPMVIKNEIFGVIEIASFHKYTTKQIEFAEKVADNIASTLSYVKTNTRTALLLKQSQIQAEELASQEEEMRQNLEELKATQEEASRKESEMQNLLDGIQSSAHVAEIELDGKIKSINLSFINFLEVAENKILGKNFGDFLEFGETDKQCWTNLSNGKIIKRIDQFKINNKDFWLSAIYTPIRNDLDQIYKIFYIASDITESKEQEMQILLQAEQMAEQEELLLLKIDQLNKNEAKLDEKDSEIEKLSNLVVKLESDYKTLKVSSENQQKEIDKKYNEEIQYLKAEISRLSKM